ncbi:hypothetical protein PTTG_25427 [Puccinia triticina 1-1 BBBD Race 1]|uniref:Uncharacterized protein n=2 Tax=Puccinia triticina TaxID=208348 RepID=A0A180H2G5_PUCT1|nr:uncharacterized protein PtA15_4A324 [Puccinia triticina]OAV98994.1 hypothetical protein PTTG_25427 [Puccinia triticina 1-1 BBBD Race 1]WAQ83875.1 hypothetical protein PtA15_4A324 [Puccinia triticina]
MAPPRSISPDSLQSSISSCSGHSFGSVRSAASSSVPIHPTLFIRDPRRKNPRNAHQRHQLTESDFGFRSPTSLSTKIRRLLSVPALLPKALLNRHHHQPQSPLSQSSSCQPSSPLSRHHPAQSSQNFIGERPLDK